MQKSKKLKIILSMVIAILSVVLIVFMAMKFGSKSPNEHSGNHKTDESVPTVMIETPYCVLRYPEQWKDQMTVKESTVDGMLVETFYAVIEGKHYELYTVYFGNSPNGDLFGYLKRDEKNIPVYIECHKLTDKNDFPENELPLFYSMMEGVNEVAQSIAAASGYYKP